ncbi:hybrid sensor histidine kinase/response regulator [Paucibacter sp. DJ1R-11]|uniref:ATP-binding response regulator n=1 Tax=Paucibacter sp. DJ1R-11 TaxID=2893556 RepID=UPI0021E4D04F|nr:hybrid sensor histidine kinase/response regulator [Paucibacter sp. DJ1R-11]MCV2364894.1 hybrid sensor histidine kinase/response regulator [Paucibacter sp. DJ1R-11]
MNRPIAAEQASVDEELLRLLAQQGRRMPYPVGISAAVICVMAWQGSGHWLTLLWLAVVLAVLALRWWGLGRLASWRHLSLARRLRAAIGLSLLNGLVFSASLGFVPFFDDYQRMVQTMLLLGLCAGSVATTAGYAPVLLAFLLPVSLANSLSWLVWHAGGRDSSWLEVALGALILGFAWILASLGRDAYRVFVESVLIRQQQAQTNQQLRLALQKAEQAMEAKTRFLASASHDLRQPMHTLSLLGSALVRRPLDSESSEIGRHMNLALQSLASQMDGLLDISKLDAQVVPVANQVFCLSSWLQRLCQEMAQTAEGKGLSLKLDCPAAVYVDTDPLLLERVLRNLIDNAIKYTDQGGVHVEVVAETDDEDGEDLIWRINVRDTGRGIAPAEQSRIFEEFYQIGNAERDRAKGLGLGLSIVSRMVDLLDLPLQLCSTPGQGSCFSLSIAAAEGSGVPELAPAGAARRLPHLYVLVLDDEAPVREAMRALLSSHGCEVVTTGSTREALLKCMVRRPDIVLTDFRLRDGDDGISALNSLRNALPGLPAVLITGDTAPERLREAHAAGLVLLHKPVLEEQLVAAIHTALMEAGGVSPISRVLAGTA